MHSTQHTTKPITIPFELFIHLLFNKKESFLEDSDAFLREKMYVSATMAQLLATWDKEQLHVVVLGPRTEFNDSHQYTAYTREAWKTSEPYFLKLKTSQQENQAQYILREEKLKELTLKIMQDVGFDEEYANGVARMCVFKRNITMAKMYGVDISMLSEEITKKTKVI